MSNHAVPKQDVIAVASDGHLAEICQHWTQDKEKYSLLALDSEFMRSRTYYPLPALLQINDGENNYLIDPLALKDLSPLKAIIVDPEIVKAMHAGSEDIEVLYRLFDCVPESLIDTQIAAALLGYGYTMGYGNLVAKLYSIDLPKGETRSDWLQRPLSDSQKGYAAQDVEYLFPLAKRLVNELHEKSRYQWLLEESQKLIQNFLDAQADDIGFLKFKAGWKYSSRDLEIIKRLYVWREKVAREKDMPKNHVIKEVCICLIAEQKPNHVAQLRNVELLSPRAIRQYGKDIVEAVDAALAVDEKLLPAKQLRPLSASQKKQSAAYKEKFCALANSMNISPEIFVRKTELESLVRQGSDETLDQQKINKAFSGWRLKVIEQTLFASQQ